MSIKNELRKKYKQARKNISEKRSKDKLINEFLCNMECYKSCDMVLFYAALDDEVNLDLSIKASLDYGKKVALPVNFCTLVDDYTDAICIVPAIAFDKSGYRLGYGKGYYDRFLCNFDGISIGISYDECITQKLCVDSFDIPVDYIVTQSGVFSTAQGGKNG